VQNESIKRLTFYRTRELVHNLGHRLRTPKLRGDANPADTCLALIGAVLNLQGSDFAHPRSFATNVRILGYYVREQHVLTLENAIRKMTSPPAQIKGISDRGQIHEGFAADVVLFDPDQVGETNSYDKPNSYAKGVPYVLVNGVVVIDKGMHTSARPGKVVHGPGYKREQLKSEAHVSRP
jgi:N-acyl-D-aspartate/D-glutamate deacylase